MTRKKTRFSWLDQCLLSLIILIPSTSQFRMPKWSFVIGPRRQAYRPIPLLTPVVFTYVSAKVKTLHFQTMVSKLYVQWTTSSKYKTKSSPKLHTLFENFSCYV